MLLYYKTNMQSVTSRFHLTIVDVNTYTLVLIKYKSKGIIHMTKTYTIKF